jgi:hypothetical protein
MRARAHNKRPHGNSDETTTTCDGINEASENGDEGNKEWVIFHGKKKATRRWLSMITAVLLVAVALD